MQVELNWPTVQEDLLANGFIVVANVLSTESCDKLIAAYDDDIYRSTITMERYNFGRGEYKYYAYPLPTIIQNLRQYFYKNLRPVAKEWAGGLKLSSDYPEKYDDYLALCHRQGQCRPTPLILKYAQGDYNTLHQDLYGDIHFPYQVAIMLSDPDDYAGGEFTLIEQRPRMQSVAHIEKPKRGDAIIFAVNEFPKLGKKGYYRARLRHGVARLKSGSRHTVGIILHDAK
ncbi:MAG: 2OG-Fe(II) oxygenase [Kordiimonadaceae bacterium]|nr:2OG-Fe(II) oxygenase [Kordiimonadaceae bacterium]